MIPLRSPYLRAKFSAAVGSLDITTLFATVLATGTGATQPFTTGFAPDLVWHKDRSRATGHTLWDSARGASTGLDTSSTAAEASGWNTSFNATGFVDNGVTAGQTYADWVFKQHSRFFKIITYTGNGTTQKIPHGLDAAVSVGMVVIKRRDAAAVWYAWHRSTPGQLFFLNNTNAAAAGTAAQLGNNTSVVDPDATGVTIGNHAAFNAAGGTYVMYVFAHDTASDGVIQCGLTSGTTATLGWRPQFVIKRLPAQVDNWAILDTARGWAAGSDNYLLANTTGAEASADFGDPTTTGFTSPDPNSIFVAIRAPTPPPITAASVFATSLYTGTGAAQTITNGIDNAGQGGLVWSKGRANPYSYQLFDTARSSSYLSSDATTAETASGTFSAQSSGFTNTFAAAPYVAWNFRQHPRFFKIVTYTGDGALSRVIPHGLDPSVSVGMVVVKSRSANGFMWAVWHRSLTGKYLALNTTAAAVAGYAQLFGNGSAVVDPNSVGVTLGNDNTVNAAGTTYVMYVFAHDTASDGVIQCGSAALDGAGSASVALGWRPQFMIEKLSSTATHWQLLDTARGWGSGNDAYLSANATTAEAAFEYGAPTANGFTLKDTASQTAIYVAIRAPQPSLVDSVFATSLYTGNGATQNIVNGIDNAGQGGLVWTKSRSGATGHGLFDTARGRAYSLQSNSTAAELTSGAGSDISSFNSNGVTIGTQLNIYDNDAGVTYALWNFRQHSRFLKIVTYTGNGANRVIPHGLDPSVSVGMVIIKRRSLAANWYTWHRGVPGKFFLLNTTDAAQAGAATLFGDGTTVVDPSASGVPLGTSGNVNLNGETYVMYVFAHDPAADGMIQCGSVAVGNSVTLGWQPQFLLGKDSQIAAGWIMLDSARGWGAGADPFVMSQAVSAESTGTDFGQPGSTGFTTTSSFGTAGDTLIYVAIRDGAF